jgi:hypothetical protein
MGIFVPEATLPSGVVVSNVYMSFTDEAVYIAQLAAGPGRPQNAKWNVASHYRVFKDKAAALSKKSNIRIPYQVPVEKLDKNSYTLLYEGLKKEYPGSYDDIEPSQLPSTSNLVISNETLVSLFMDINSDEREYIVEPGTSNLVMTSDMLAQFSNVINSFTFTLAPEPAEDEGDVPVNRGAALIEEALNNTEN